MSKIEVKDGEFIFNEPVTFDDIYDNTIRLIIEMYPKTEDFIDAMSDLVYDGMCIDFREWIVDEAKEKGMYIETEE